MDSSILATDNIKPVEIRNIFCLVETC